MAVPCCGPKLSICCTLLSIWGIIMLALLGVFFRIGSPALIEDIAIDEEKWAQAGYPEEYVMEQYGKVSNNCFIAAGLYVATFIVSVIMWKINAKSDYNMS